MEYVEASNLKELYTRHDRVLLENVAQILIDMAEGLEHMHENGYMHLDFKPENVLVTRNGKVRLVDFDLAQPIPEKPKKDDPEEPRHPRLHGPGTTIRPADFASGGHFSLRRRGLRVADQSEAISGRYPRRHLKRQLDRSSFVAPSQYNPEMPAGLEKVIVRCLEREPERRYPFMGVMVRELQAALYV